MSPFFIQAIQLLLSLSLLIVLHEFGHFLPAKLFKTRVEKFYLFFDVKFSLFKKKIGETVYGIGWLPLGGYVKISGMVDESMDKEQMAQPPKPWEFRSKPSWQRLIIMLGGVTMNIIVAVVIFILMFFAWGDYRIKEMPEGFAVHEMFEELGFQDGDNILAINGEEYEISNPMEINSRLFVRDIQNITVLHQNGETETLAVPEDIGDKMFRSGVMKPFLASATLVVKETTKGSPAEEASLQEGDKILSVNGIEVKTMPEFGMLVAENKDKPLNLLIKRETGIENIVVKPNEEGLLGVVYTAVPNIELEKIEYGFLESIGKGLEKGYWQTHDYIAQLGYVFTPKGAQSLGGFGTIGSLYPETWNWQGFWEITAIISIILAVMNLLPIPALDGGHVMFLLYEMITNRKPNEKIMEYAQIAGFFILIALFIYANGNDVYRFLFK